MEKQELLKRYEKYNEDIQKYMDYIIDSLIEKYGEVYPHYLISMDVFAMNLDIMMQAKQIFDTEGFQHKDHNNIQRKSGAVQAFNTAQQAALKIMSQFGLNPMSASKIKDNKTARETQNYLDELING